MPLISLERLLLPLVWVFCLQQFQSKIAIATVGDKQRIATLMPTVQQNKFSQLSIDVPLEFRWRTSTYGVINFGALRIKTELFVTTLFFDGSAVKRLLLSNADFNKIQYGTYISAGYNTINLYALWFEFIV
jgi:hypothetical protein